MIVVLRVHTNRFLHFRPKMKDFVTTKSFNREFLHYSNVPAHIHSQNYFEKTVSTKNKYNTPGEPVI